MKFSLITDSQALKQLCDDLENSTVLMLDTEFVRTRTFYPSLGLIQVYDGKTLALLDTLAIKDLSPFWQLLKKPSITKVLHACSEDLEVFLQAAGFIPTPMIDTQILAAFLGHGVSMGFAALVEHYLGVTVDKCESRTNWCQRPLTESQLQYAAADVYYLWPLYHILHEQIVEKDWLDAAKYECQQLVNRRSRVPDSELAYLDIKNAWQLEPHQLAVLRALAQWRSKEAQRRNLALNFVIKDTNLWKITRYRLNSLEKMQKAEVDRNEIQRHGMQILRIMNQAEQLPSQQWPDRISRLVENEAYKPMVDSFKQQITALARQLELAPEFLGSKRQIEQVLKWDWFYQRSEQEQPELLSGWRGDYLKAPLLAILDAQDKICSENESQCRR
ncbi:MAG: ribonuclease D [Vibrionaceae bacterium]